jgi:GAF domain-containing protein
LQDAAARGTTQAIENVSARAQQQAEQREAQAEASRRTQADPVAQTVWPVVGPALRDVAIKADHGRDAAIFYATNPSAGRYSGQIEARVNELGARNIQVDRHSVFNLLKGENLSSFVDEEIKNRENKIREAEQAAVISGSRGGTIGQQARDPYDMTPEELTQALDNIAF